MEETSSWSQFTESEMENHPNPPLGFTANGHRVTQVQEEFGVTSRGHPVTQDTGGHEASTIRTENAGARQRTPLQIHQDIPFNETCCLPISSERHPSIHGNQRPPPKEDSVQDALTKKDLSKKEDASVENDNDNCQEPGPSFEKNPVVNGQSLALLPDVSTEKTDMFIHPSVDIGEDYQEQSQPAPFPEVSTEKEFKDTENSSKDGVQPFQITNAPTDDISPPKDCTAKDVHTTVPDSPGILIGISRFWGLYYHYVIYIGDGYVVHRTGGKRDWIHCIKGRIKKEKLDDVIRPGDDYVIENESWEGKEPLPEKEIIERALSRIGEQGFNLLFSNCEGFARWCRYGEPSSPQADNLVLILKGIFFFGICAVCATTHVQSQ